MLSRQFALLCLLCLSTNLAHCQETAEPAATPDQATLLQQAAELRQQAAPFRQAEQQGRQQAQQLQVQLLETQQLLLKTQRELEALQKSVAEMEAKLKTEQEAAAKAAAEKAQADQVYADAAKALAEAQKKNDEARAAAEAAAKVAEEAAGVAQKSAESVQGLVAKTGEVTALLEKSRGQVALIQQQQTETLAAAETAYREWLQREKSAESALRQAGAWVSFAAEVAPIFQQRCLACHNARTAKGRYNMENYAAIIKGGESGPAVEPANRDSLLCTVVADGSMPQDADPLTADQIALITRWVELGGQLDAGLDPQAPLIRIMPKFPQPAPPEHYRVPAPVTAVAFSPDGTLVASSGYHEVLLWSVETGELVRRITNVAERTYGLVFHPDGTRLAVAAGTPGRIGEVKLFQVADGALLADWVKVDDAMFCVAFSPDGQRLAAGGADRAIRLFDLNTGEEQRVIEDHADWVLGIAWSPDGSKLVSASRDKTSKIFDAQTGDALGTFNGHGEVVAAAAFLADGAHVISGGRDKQLRVWQIADAKEIRKIGGFGDEITQLLLLPDNRVVTACADRQARLHNANDAKGLHTYSGATDWLHSVAVHAATGKVAAGTFNGEVRIWNLEDGQPVRHWIAAP